MCGIVGYIGRRDAIPVLLEGLRSLEYRGYDSAGLAVIHRGTAADHQDRGPGPGPAGQGRRDRAKATIGIGHTRWATHGEPNDVNAHPHTDTRGPHRPRAQRHHRERRAAPGAAHRGGVKLVSDTDTEALAHMIAAEAPRRRPASRTRSAAPAPRRGYLRPRRARHAGIPTELVVARNGSPIVLGIGESRDVRRLRRRRAGPLHPAGRLPGGRRGRDGARRPTTAPRRSTSAAADGSGAARADHRGAPTRTTTSSARTRTTCARRSTSSPRRCAGRCAAGSTSGSPPPSWAGSTWTRAQLRAIRQVKFLGCGSAYYAGQMGAVLVEELARIPSDAEPASEFRYRNPVVDPDTLYVGGQPVRRDARHADGGAGAAAQGRPGHRRGQRGGQRDRARVRPRHLPARGPGDRRRLHQGADQHGGHVRHARAAPRPGPRPVARPTAGGSSPACARCRARSRRSWPPRRRSPRSRAGSPGPSTCSSSAGSAAGRWPARARRSSRRSPTSTPRPTRRPS